MGDDLVGDLVGDVLAGCFFEHVAGSICLSRRQHSSPCSRRHCQTYDFLVDAAVFLCVLSHRTTELLLGLVEAWHGVSSCAKEL